LLAGALALVLPVAPLLADTPAAVPPAGGHGVYFPESFTLANGLQVVVVTNHRVPVVSQMIWYKVGAADETPGKSGIAHFLEHLMFKGTPTVGPGEFSRQVSLNGGRDNAFTSWDYTAFFETVASDRLELVLRLEADRMVNLTLSDAVVEPERDVVLEERRQRTLNSPTDRLAEPLIATVFSDHPYGRPIIGWEPEIRDLKRADAEAFYKTWYAPNNAILVLSGDVEAATLKPLVEKYFGTIPAKAVPARWRPQTPRLGAEREVILRDREVRQPLLEKVYLAPSFLQGESADVLPLQLLAEIVGGGATSRLHRALVVERRIASGVGFSYQPNTINLATVTVSASPLPGADSAALEAALNQELARLAKDGVSAEEVATAQKRLLAQADFARDSVQGPAHVLGSALAIGRTIDQVESWPERIAAVTAEQVTAAARRLLNQPDAVTARLLPPAESAAQP